MHNFAGKLAATEKRLFLTMFSWKQNGGPPRVFDQPKRKTQEPEEGEVASTSKGQKTSSKKQKADSETQKYNPS